MKNQVLKSVSIICMCLLTSLHVNAQDVILKGLDVIQNNGVVQGYFVFVEIDKLDRKNSLFQFEIYDMNLKLTHTKQVEKPKRTVLAVKKATGYSQPLFNGSHFCLLFHEMDRDGKFVDKYYYEFFDKEGNSMGEVDVTSEKGLRNGQIHSNPNMGFIGLAHRKVKGLKRFRSLLYNYDNKGEIKWKIPVGSHEKSDVITMTWFGCMNNDKIYLNNYSNSVVYSKDMDKAYKDYKSNLSVYDTKTGNTLNNVSILDKNHKHYRENQFYKMVYDEKSDLVHVITKITKPTFQLHESSGIIISTFDKDGQPIGESTLLWTDDGFKDLIGEGYSINISQLDVKVLDDGSKVIMMGLTPKGKGMSILGGDKENNIVVLRVSSLNKLVELKIIEIGEDHGRGDAKTWNHFGNYFYSGFEFMVVSEDKKKVNLVFTEFNFGKEHKGSKHSIGVVEVDINGDWKESKFTLNSSPQKFKVFPAKPGYVAVYEYFENEKKLDFRLEKIDF
jgi:hypothetical protein